MESGILLLLQRSDVSVECYGRFNVEKIVGCNPDLVLMTISGWGQYRKHLDLSRKA